MKLQLIVVVISCTFLVLSCASVTESDQNVFVNNSEDDSSIEAIAEKPDNVASTEIQEILSKIRAAAEKPLQDEGAEVQTEPINISAKNTSGTNREAKQLIGFVPAYVLREALRFNQEQEEYQNLRSSQYVVDDDDDDDDAYDDLEEERAIRRRKRFRKRNLQSHLRKSHRHSNTNRSKQQNRRRHNSNRKTQNRHQSSQRRSTRNKPKKSKRKNSKRRGGYY